MNLLTLHDNWGVRLNGRKRGEKNMCERYYNTCPCCGYREETSTENTSLRCEDCKMDDEKKVILNREQTPYKRVWSLLFLLQLEGIPKESIEYALIENCKFNGIVAYKRKEE